MSQITTGSGQKGHARALIKNPFGFLFFVVVVSHLFEAKEGVLVPPPLSFILELERLGSSTGVLRTGVGHGCHSGNPLDVVPPDGAGFDGFTRAAGVFADHRGTVPRGPAPSPFAEGGVSLRCLQKACFTLFGDVHRWPNTRSS